MLGKFKFSLNRGSGSGVGHGAQERGFGGRWAVGQLKGNSLVSRLEWRGQTIDSATIDIFDSATTLLSTLSIVSKKM
jgi:hypothetical protein